MVIVENAILRTKLENKTYYKKTKYTRFKVLKENNILHNFGEWTVFFLSRFLSKIKSYCILNHVSYFYGFRRILSAVYVG